MSEKSGPSRDTLAVWGGEEGKDFWLRSTQAPVVHSVSFGYQDMDEWLKFGITFAISFFGTWMLVKHVLLKIPGFKRVL